MINAFIRIVDIGISTSFLIAVIAILRFVLKKVPKTYFYILWCIVGIRLMIPVSIINESSLIPYEGFQSYLESFAEANNRVGSKVCNSSTDSLIHNNPSSNNVINKKNISYAADDDANDVSNESIAIKNTRYKRMFIVLKAASIVWILGIVLMLAYMVISSLILMKKLETAVPLIGSYYQSDKIKSPFVFGVFRTRIYIPFSVDKDNHRIIMVHEMMHIDHLDNLVKVIGFIILSVYWFVPFVWLAYYLFCKDMEGTCDESVIRRLGSEYKKKYAEALLSCADVKNNLPICPVAFGISNSMKNRVQNVLNYKRSSFWRVLALIFLTAGVMVLCIPTKVENSINSKFKQIEEFNQKEAILWYEDLTHDGADETIAVYLDNSFINRKDSVKTIKIYSGQTDELIWEKYIRYEGGLYIYNNPLDGQAYLISWSEDISYNEYVSFNEFYSEIDIYYLSENGDKTEPDDGALGDALNNAWFYDGCYNVGERLWNYYSTYLPILSDSYALIDTSKKYAENALYSTENNKVTSAVKNEDVLDRYFSILNYSEEPEIFYEDLTHDGIDDCIRKYTNIKYDDGTTDDKKSRLWIISVYSGKTGQLVYVNSSYYDNLYIYHDPEDGKAYMMTTNALNDTLLLGGDIGEISFNYNVFLLTENRNEQIKKENDELIINYSNYNDSDFQKAADQFRRYNELIKSSYILNEAKGDSNIYDDYADSVTHEIDVEKKIEEIRNGIVSGEMEKTVWYEDLTNDGVDERIEVTFNALYPEYNNENIINVYLGQTDELIWCGQKKDNIAYNIYNDALDNRTYLLIWNTDSEYLENDHSYEDSFRYKIFSLTESGEEVVTIADKLSFIRAEREAEEKERIETFIKDLNEYLVKGYVLYSNNKSWGNDGSKQYLIKTEEILSEYLSAYFD